MKYIKTFEDKNWYVGDNIKKVSNFEDEMKKRKSIGETKIKLGDSVAIGKKVSNNDSMLKNPKYYRCIGINPDIKVQEIITIKGVEELAEIRILSQKEIDIAKNMGNILGMDLSHSWSIRK